MVVVWAIASYVDHLFESVGLKGWVVCHWWTIFGQVFFYDL